MTTSIWVIWLLARTWFQSTLNSGFHRIYVYAFISHDAIFILTIVIAEDGDSSEKPAHASWKEFVRYLLDDKRKIYIDAHWQLFSKMCYPCDVTYHYIAKLETIYHDAQYISSLLNYDITPFFPSEWSLVRVYYWYGALRSVRFILPRDLSNPYYLHTQLHNLLSHGSIRDCAIDARGVRRTCAALCNVQCTFVSVYSVIRPATLKCFDKKPYALFVQRWPTLPHLMVGKLPVF